MAGSQRADRTNAGVGLSVPKPQANRPKAAHHQFAKGLGRDAQKGWRRVFLAVRASPHLRNPAQRGRRGRSFREPDVAAGRRWRVQTLQPSKAQHDARVTQPARQEGQRARADFWYTRAELMDFWNTFGTL